ncbi:Zn-ribbon domain-containing OB-fold protein [Bordetella petrii]|uniref:Zn-ribbon domain-containing OB-fold protein n=1 Tax=Bordetella petrii TaxID=94624 RepID=UPI001A97CDC3|nr:OB-fold domain-containing protein [Bordetella petrii]MBO1114553.1 OB-fold domain-containing protein [Bordetella petrii]
MNPATHARHPLDLQRCDGCGAWWALRPYACAACGGTALRWRRAAGAGVVIARSEVHRAPDPQWRALAPYVLVLVRLREDVTLMGHADAGIAIGQAVSGRAAELNGRTLLKFEACRPP